MNGVVVIVGCPTGAATPPGTVPTCALAMLPSSCVVIVPTKNTHATDQRTTARPDRLRCCGRRRAVFVRDAIKDEFIPLTINVWLHADLAENRGGLTRVISPEPNAPDSRLLAGHESVLSEGPQLQCLHCRKVQWHTSAGITVQARAGQDRPGIRTVNLEPF